MFDVVFDVPYSSTMLMNFQAQNSPKITMKLKVISTKKEQAAACDFAGGCAYSDGYGSAFSTRV